MKKIICAVLICCAAFMLTACAYDNGMTAEYSLNAVVMWAGESDGVRTVEIAPIVPIYYDLYLDEAPAYGDQSYGHVYDGEYDDDYDDFYYDDYYYDSLWETFIRSSELFSFRVSNKEAYEALSDIASGKSGRIYKFTVMDGRIIKYEDTGCFYREDLNDIW